MTLVFRRAVECMAAIGLLALATSGVSCGTSRVSRPITVDGRPLLASSGRPNEIAWVVAGAGAECDVVEIRDLSDGRVRDLGGSGTHACRSGIDVRGAYIAEAPAQLFVGGND